MALKRKSGRLSRLKYNNSQVSPTLQESLKQGIIEFETGNYQSAAEHLSNAIALDPFNVDLLETLGYSYLQTGKFEESISVFSDIIRLDPGNESALKQLANASFQAEDWKGAEQAFRELIKKQPSDSESLNDLGVLLHRRGNLDEAKSLFLQSLESNADNVDATHNLGLIHMESGDYEEAVKNFVILKSQFPDDIQIRKLLTESLLQNGKADEALVEVKKIIDSNFEDSESLYFLGKAYYCVDNLDLALDAFTQSLEINPDNLLAKESLATTLLKSGKADEALSIWESILHLPEREKKVSTTVISRLTGWDKISEFKIIHPTINNKNNGVNHKTAEISIVIPVFQEEENIELLTKELQEVMKEVSENYEIIFIDDGSKDGTFDVLSRMRKNDSRIKVLRFRKNYGQTAALSAGFNYAVGDVVVTLDGDLQNDPADIPRMIEKLAEGYDMVSGWRLHRKDKLLTRRIPSIIANKIIGKITGTKLHDYGCALKVYKKGVIKNIKLYGEMHRFIPAIVSWLGAEIAEMPVNHRPRTRGTTKYDLTRTWRVILDLINVKFLLSYITRPLQYFGKIGLIFIFLSMAVIVGVMTAKIAYGVNISSTLMFSTVVFMALMGIQFITMGLMAEIVIRTYHESQDKPIYVIREVLD